MISNNDLAALSKKVYFAKIRYYDIVYFDLSSLPQQSIRVTDNRKLSHPMDFSNIVLEIVYSGGNSHITFIRCSY